jgi:hypothetical protein
MATSASALAAELLAQHGKLPPFGVGEPRPLLAQPLQQSAIHRLQIFDLVRLMTRDPHAHPRRQKLKRHRQRCPARV